MKGHKRWNPRNLCVALTVLIISAVVINIYANITPTEAAGVQRYETIVVHQGDTLWGIAEKYSPSEDPRKVIDQIVQVNQLTGVTIIPGQALNIPTASY